MVEYAHKEIKDHIGRFTKLYRQIIKDDIDAEYLLDIFTKDDMTPDDLIAAMKLTMELQSGAEQQFQTLYISEIQNLYVCDVATLSYKQYPISEELCKKFFINSI